MKSNWHALKVRDQIYVSKLKKKIYLFIYNISVYMPFPSLFLQEINYKIDSGISCADSWYVKKYEPDFEPICAYCVQRQGWVKL